MIRLALSAAILLSLGAGACVAATPIPDTNVAILNTNPASTPESATSRFNFGTAFAMGGKPIEHVFVLRNNGPTPVIVDHLQPSCGCTSAAAEPGSVLSAPIAPGGSARVRVSVDVNRVNSGAVSKSVLVILRGQVQPAAVLEVYGTMNAGVDFSPSVVDFGDVRAGTSKTINLRAALDAGLPSQAAPTLVSSVSGLTVGAPHRAKAAPAMGATFDYPLSITDKAYIGMLSGTVSVAEHDPQGNRVSSDVSVAVRGRVVGAISADPSMLAITDAVVGKSAHATFTLHAPNARLFQGLLVTCPSAHVALHTHTEAGPAGDARMTVGVTVNTLPEGVLETQVLVTTHSGQQLSLPLYVLVSAAPQH